MAELSNSNPTTERRVSNMITIFFVTVAANVVSHYIIKWLNKKH